MKFKKNLIQSVDVNILDCSLRDGGYYCNWDFDFNLVEKYINEIIAAKVDAIELGFRMPPQERFLGAFAYTTDDIISNFEIPTETVISVMINASQIASYNKNISNILSLMFNNAAQSRVDLVRVASSIDNLDNVQEITSHLKSFGYQIALNLMQVSNIPIDNLKEICKRITEWEAVDILYIADSLGSMEPSDVGITVQAICQEWEKPLGVHTHDNKGLALSNTLAAFRAGAKWLDSTILGMGRGAGNTRTETLMLELSECGVPKYQAEALYPIVMNDFTEMQGKYRWGPNLLYHLAAVYGIHPTYIQELVADDRYSTEQRLNAIEFLKANNARVFHQDNLHHAINGQPSSVEGSWDATNWSEDRSILIVGSGPGVKRHLKGIVDFIKRKRPIVLCLNTQSEITDDLVTAYIACNETRIMIEAEHYQLLKKPIIIPFGIVNNFVKKQLENVTVYDYGISTNKGVFEPRSTDCTVPGQLAIAYALAVAVQGNAKKIYLAGFDGYAADDRRQKEMNQVVDLFLKLNQLVPLIAVTPTTYQITQSSIYSPGL